MVGQLAAERPLDHRLLEAPDRRLELLVRERPLADELIENLRRDRRQRRVRRQALPFAGHRHSSCYAPHTKFLTPSFDLRDQLKESAASAPRLIAEGFGRYYPAEFSKYLRFANGELKETIESLDDGVDRRHFTKRTRSFRYNASRSDPRRPHLA